MKHELEEYYIKLSLITKTIESAEDCYVNFCLIENAFNDQKKICELSYVSLNVFKFACLYQSIMNLCKVFTDINNNAYTIKKLFDDMESNNQKFSEPQKVSSVIKSLKIEMLTYNESIKRLKLRRNKMYAHNDKEYFGDKKKIIEELPLFFADKECLIEFGINSCSELRKLFINPDERILHCLYGDNKDFNKTIDFVQKNYK